MARRNNQRSDYAPRKVTPARLAAFEILRRVEEEGAYASLLLSTTTEHLRADDRALVYELVLGTLRWQLWLDSLIEHFAGGRGAHGLDPPVRRALRLGLYQLRFLTRIPASAAVNESVNLSHVGRFRSASGFINAILRRASREPDYDPTKGITEPLQRLSIESSHPLWMIERWSQAFGFAEVEALALANNHAPPVAFRLNSLRPDESSTVIEQLEKSGGAVAPSMIAPGAWRLTKGSAALLQGFAREGEIYLQDEASQLVAYALGAGAGAQPAEHILDVCAAPGSKTTHIAVLTGDQARIVAGDYHPHRLQTLRESAARQHLRSIQTVTFNAEQSLPFAEQSFERVLVDAPCSGTGTLRHNPEIRWRISPTDISQLAGRQKRILHEASKQVRNGGRLVYSTCSVEPEENEAVITDFTKNHPAFRIMADVFDEALRTSTGAARTWPHRQGADGFFVAVLERAG